METYTHDEIASPNNDFNEPGTFYACANQNNQIISLEK